MCVVVYLLFRNLTLPTMLALCILAYASVLSTESWLRFLGSSLCDIHIKKYKPSPGRFVPDFTFIHIVYQGHTLLNGCEDIQHFFNISFPFLDALRFVLTFRGAMSANSLFCDPMSLLIGLSHETCDHMGKGIYEKSRY